MDQVKPICPATAKMPTAASSHHSRADGWVQPRRPGTPVISAPARQNAAHVSQAPAVLRTPRVAATAAPERTAETAPTGTLWVPGAASVSEVPNDTSTTPAVA